MATHTRAWLAQPASWARERGWRSRLSRRGSGLHSPAGGEGCSGGSPLHASRGTRAHEDSTARGGRGETKKDKNMGERKTDREMVWTDDRKAGMNQRVTRVGMDMGRVFNLNTLVFVSRGHVGAAPQKLGNLSSNLYRPRMALIFACTWIASNVFDRGWSRGQLSGSGVKKIQPLYSI